MARRSNLDAVYIAMYALRDRGEPLTATAVARESGLTRGTFYQPNDSDWINVLKMIDGELPIPLPTSSRPKMGPATTKRHQVLARRAAEMEARIVKLEELADVSQKKLLAQLHHFFQKSSIAPTKKDELLKARRQASVYEQQVRKLASENDRLYSEAAVSRVVQLKGSKRVISIPSSIGASKALEHFCTAFGTLFSDSPNSSLITSVTLVCGLPQSGKSTWIAAQSPIGVGITLYVEGPFHTRSLRDALRHHLLEQGSMKLGCAWLTTRVDTCLNRAYLANDNDELPDAIERMHNEREVVSVVEPFDFIFGVSGE